MTDSYDKLWNTKYEQLVEFKRKNGHCRVPRRYQEDVTLGNWVNTQRKSHSENKLRLDRKELLEKLGFIWKVRGPSTDKTWHQQYEKLVKLKRNNGHCLVPQGYEKDVSLGMWINTQRQFHSKNKLRLDRKVLLDDIGFVWKVRAWNAQYEKLVEFKQTNGHCLVPQGYEKDVSLGMWVSAQRTYHTNNNIRPDRKVLLDEQGFVWKGDLESTWKKQYEKLAEFKRKNGHCLVPQKYQEDVSLVKWVNVQRRRHVNNKMRLDRKGLLDEIGFVWKADTLAARASTTDDLDSETFTSTVGTEPAGQGHAQKRRLGLERNLEYRNEHDSPAALLGLWKKISTHRTSVVFRRPVTPKEAPGYFDRIIFPMDLNLIREMIVLRRIKSYADFHTRIALICHNCVKYNGRKSEYGLLTRKFERVADKFMVAAVMTMRVDETNTAMAVASVPVAKNPETQLACPSPNVKRTRTCLAESEQMAARTNPIGGAIGSRSSVEKDGDRDEEDSEPSLGTSSSALIASYPDQEIVQQEATHYEIPPLWKRVKLEPDC